MLSARFPVVAFGLFLWLAACTAEPKINAPSGSSAVCRPPIELGVRFVGRVDGCDPSGVRFAWSGSGFVARFRGTGLGVRLKEPPNQYTVLVDGALGPTLKTSQGEARYALATGLANAEHVVELYRRTEASFGDSVVTGIDVEGEGGALLAPPSAPARRLEIIGDSISCGFGNEGPIATCPFSADTENHYLTYGALLSRELGAELMTTAWSGKGVVSNYNGNKVEPMPQIYGRAAANDPKSVWDFAWKPDAVIINLGTNDYSTDHDPGDAEFTAGYRELLERVRVNYPEAFILCTIGPMLGGDDLAKARANIAAAVKVRVEAGDAKVVTHELITGNANPGCDYHPSLATHAAMSAELSKPLRAALGW